MYDWLIIQFSSIWILLKVWRIPGSIKIKFFSKKLTSCTHTSFTVFVVKETNNFQWNFIFRLFNDWTSASTHYDHLSCKLWIPRQKNCFCFATKHSLNHFPTSSKLLKCCSASVCPIDAKRWQMPPSQRITAAAEGCPIQAISRCLSSVLMCETGHCRVTKSLCHVSCSIPVIFRSMCDSN